MPSSKWGRRFVPLILFSSVLGLCAGCRNATPESKSDPPRAITDEDRTEASKFNDGLRGNLKIGQTPYRRLVEEIAAAVGHQPVDKEKLEKRYQEVGTLLQAARSGVESAMRGPAAATTEAFRHALLQYIEQLQQQHRTVLRDALTIVEDDALSVKEKQAKIQPILQQVEQEADRQAEAAEAAQRAFAKEFDLSAW